MDTNCGILQIPSTPLETIYPQLQTGLIDMVYMLFAEPGFGRQLFQICVLDKIRTLQAWIDWYEIACCNPNNLQ